MNGLVMAVRPLTDSHDPYILFDDGNGGMKTFELHKGMPFTVHIKNPEQRYCTGWYDIETHTNHPCETHAVVDSKFDSCFACRKKTDFNPAFYNSLEISEKQQAYNNTPHTVYIAYFGDGLAKAGIMADSRGLDRLYEQGALWYAVAAQYSDAIEAHRLEERLIAHGLKNSVTKKQKEVVLASKIDKAHEEKRFKDLLGELKYGENEIVPLLDRFFFGSYVDEPLLQLGSNPISGRVRGMVGRYLVLENNDRLYGTWLNNLNGYEVEVNDELTPIDAPPLQASLF